MSAATTIRYEVLPFGDIVEQAADLSQPETLTVTCSPRHGLAATVEVAEALAGQGHKVIPHLAARRVDSQSSLREIHERLRRAGIEEAVVIGGDGDAGEGPYPGAFELLVALSELPEPLMTSVGGYPEGHPSISDEVLHQALLAKQRYARSLTTQMCFSERALVAWLRGIRQQGIHLPAYVGVPGEVDSTKLLEISLRIGVGNSTRQLRKRPLEFLRLFTRRAAAQHAARDVVLHRGGDPSMRLAGLHVFTFNKLSDSVQALQSV